MKNAPKKATTAAAKIVDSNHFQLGYRLGAIQGKYDGVKDIASALPPTKANFPIMQKVGELCSKTETWFEEFSTGLNSLVHSDGKTV